MKTIYKFTGLCDLKEIDVPEGAIIIGFRHQYKDRDSPTFWALVDTNAKMVKWKIYIFGTGENIDIVYRENLKLIGSLPSDVVDVLFVWHYFYKEIK